VERLFLTKNGIPFDVAFRVDDITAAAWSIIFSQLDGAEFDFGTMSYKRPEDHR
jgi:hypothetical protein